MSVAERLRRVADWVQGGFSTIIEAADTLDVQAARIAALSAENARLREALINARDQLALMARDPSANPWVIECNAALEPGNG